MLTSIARRLSSVRKKNILIEMDLQGDEPLAGLAYLLSRAQVSGAPSDASAPSQLMIISQDHIPAVLAFLDGLGPSSDPMTAPVILGSSASPKQELNKMSRKTSLLISTPQRLIDHIRRKNVSLRSVRQLCVIQPSGIRDARDLDSFDQDLLFINTRLSRSAHRVLFTQKKQQLPSTENIFPRSRTLVKQDLRPVSTAFWYEAEHLDAQGIFDYLYAQRLDNVRIVCGNELLYQECLHYSRSQNVFTTHNIHRISASSSQPLKHDHVIIAGPDEDFGSSQLLRCLCSELGSVHHFIVTAHHQQQLLPIIKENYTMGNSYSTPEAAKVLSGKISQLVKELEKDRNPEELNEIKRIIKKEVPFYRRGYFAAYLLRTLLAEGDSRPKRAPRKAAPVSQIPEENAATLFFGIGKNRRTYAKDIVRLLKQEANLENEQIGQIKTLDNYSFVSVHKDKADIAIEKLNGFEYKGRALVVNYAKSNAKKN